MWWGAGRLVGLVPCVCLLLYACIGYRLLGVVQLQATKALLMLLEPSSFNHFEVLQEEIT